MKFYRKHHGYLLLIVALFLQCSKTTQDSSTVLAVIGDYTITEDQFVQIFTDFKQKASFQDNGQTRRQVLAQMVQQKLLEMEAEKRGYTRDAVAEFERKRLEIQGLLNEYFATYISPKVTVTEADLKEYFVRFNTRIKARHIFAPTRQKADSLYRLLKNGQSFVRLASHTFTDPVLKKNGGLVGYFTVDEMHPNFEDAAFHLNVGEISRPVKIAGGYSIIKVEDKIVNPLLTESEFARKKEQLRRYVVFRKRQQAAARFVEQKRQELGVTFYPAGVQRLFAFLKQQSPGDANLQFRMEPETGVPDSLLEMPLVKSDLGEWTVQTFLEKARFTSPSEWKWIRFPEHLEEFIAGLVVREFMLKEARKAKLAEHQSFQKYFNQHWTDFVLTRLEDSVKAHIAISEDAIRAYYEANKEKFVVPPRVCLREIVVESREKAQTVERLLKQGADFAALAREYSQRTASAQRDGRLGCFSRAQLKTMGDRFFQQPVGSWFGPLQQKSAYIFYKIDDKRPGTTQPLEQVKEDIRETLRYMKMDDALKQLTERLKQEIPVKVYWKRLRTVEIKRG